MSDGIRVWDVAAGQTHTVLLADGDCLQPILYYSGEQVQAREDSPTATYTQTPTLLPFFMNVSVHRDYSVFTMPLLMRVTMNSNIIKAVKTYRIYSCTINAVLA